MKLILTSLLIGAVLYTGSILFKSNQPMNTVETQTATNVLGTPLQTCCTDPMTGYYRNGRCDTDASDRGSHVVCAIMTREFLDYTLAQGNDLCTARPEYRFPGLQPGDGWCLYAIRWKEAYDAGVAPLVKLECTHSKALQYVSLEALQSRVYTEKQ